MKDHILREIEKEKKIIEGNVLNLTKMQNLLDTIVSQEQEAHVAIASLQLENEEAEKKIQELETVLKYLEGGENDKF